jgi:hypothetical protein
MSRHVLWMMAGFGLVLMGCGEGQERLVISYSTQIDAATVDVMTVGMGNGDLTISGADSEQIEMFVELMTDREDDEDDERAKGTHVAQLYATDQGEALLTVMDPEVSDYWINISVRIPDTLPINVVDEAGDLIVENCASLQIDDGEGDIDVESILGDVHIDDGGGDTKVTHIDGNVVVYDGEGAITVQDVTGNLDIYDEGGDVSTSGIEGSTNIHDGD